MQIEIPGFILINPHGGSRENPAYQHSMYEMKEYGYVTVCPHTVTAEIPDDFDPITGMVDALKAKRSKVLAEAHQEVTKIDGQIQQLLCIENKA